jgi:tRNA A22 N-methylase
VYDVGTDYAQIPLYLAQNGRSGITASDINAAPLENAKSFLARNNAVGIDLVASKGLESISIKTPADVIIAGLGGETIAQIISDSTGKLTSANLILQPMTRPESLRRTLYQCGFEIVKEVFVLPKFSVIQAQFAGVSSEISDFFAFTGLQTSKSYLIQQAERLKKITISNKNLTEVYKQILLAIEK